MSLIKNNLSADKQVKLLLTLLLFLGFLGFLDATYLTMLHYQHTIPSCSVTNGCEVVLTSSFSTILGIPIALFGAGFFLSIITVSILLLTNLQKLFEKLLLLIASSGIIVSLILLYIQFVILKAYCQYCLITEAISFLIFVVSIFLVKKRTGSQEKS